jgi:predicted AAA+ superfamily ATPase
VVTVTGPRQSGKTTLCRNLFPNKKYVSLEELDNRSYAENDPRGFLSEYSGGVIIDEIQRVPDLLSYIQGIVDKNNKKGEYILTGSSHLALTDSISQSLAGRTALLRLLPFSYTEIYSQAEYNTDWVNNVLYTGFYPRIHADRLAPSDALASYIETYIERDVRQFYDIRNLSIFHRFLQLCAGRTGQLLNYSNIAGDCGVSVTTIQNWIAVLEQSFIIYRLMPFHTNTRKRLVKSPKLYFYDVGLCAYLNGARRVEHIDALPNRGSIYENFVISEVVKINAHHNFRHMLSFYRDKSGREVDLLIDTGLKRMPVEIKAAQTFSSDFVKSLKYYAELMDLDHLGYVVFSGESSSRTNLRIRNYYDFFKAYSEWA